MNDRTQAINNLIDVFLDDMKPGLFPDMSGNTRRGRGKSAASMALIESAKAILEEIQPATVRAVCYRLFVAGLIPSMEVKNTKRVSEQLVWARENDVIPWEWIVDETREAERPGTWDNPESILKTAVNQYRRDNWQGQRYRVEVWSEKGTVRGTLAPVLKEYGVTLRVMHGFGSATVIKDICTETEYSDSPLRVLYVGDHDPSGMGMSELDLPERCERYGGRVIIQRVALTRRDIDEHNLPSFPAKQTDSRHQWYVRRYGHRAWELDAMPPPILRQKVTTAIRSYLDLGLWEQSLMVESAEVESMSKVFATWKALSAKGAQS